MKRIISFIISFTLLLSIFVSCKKNDPTISQADDDTALSYADYYPYNTFTDCDENYIYFSSYESINKFDTANGGIYRMSRQGGKAELIYENAAVEDSEKAYEHTPPILSIACWHGYIYFLRFNSIYRLSIDSGECIQLFNRNDLAQYLLHSPNSLRIFNDILYISTYDVEYINSYIAFDLNISDTLKMVHDMQNSENCESAPLYDNIQYDDGDYRIKNGLIKLNKNYAYFDYQANCIGYLLKDIIKLYDYRGSIISNISLESNCPFITHSSDSGENWTNFSDKKAYKFFKIKTFSDTGELVSQDDRYSLVIYDLEHGSYKIIGLDDEFLPLLHKMDVINEKVYWWLNNNIACYDINSDTLYTII